ncbi:MAG: HNH endonuclease [Burkholderiaceae bacterium]|nr:HNH endonuclease [Burkholderiaceae bacterium]
MALSLKDRRLRAHAQQGGLCFYCCLPICEGDVQFFRRRYGLTAREAQSLLSTAEHLVARKDGGTDGNSNVVAACWTCNQGRHQRKNRDLNWQQFQELVQKRLRQRKWRAKSLLAKICSNSKDGRNLLAWNFKHDMQCPTELKLTPFRGHLILMEKGVRNADDEAALPGGVQATDGRAGARRAQPGRAWARVQMQRAEHLDVGGARCG